MSVKRAYFRIFVSFCIVASVFGAGCGLVAGLKDNIDVESGIGGNGGSAGGGMGGTGGSGWKPIPLPAGFMDSRNALCSDGTNVVSCEHIQSTMPGQDGHYLTMTPVFEPIDPAKPTEMKETNTKLTWWYKAGKNLGFDAATTYCQNLGGGYRLPTRIELITLLEYNGEGPTLLDEKVFQDLEPTIAWTSSAHHLSANAHWVVNLCTDCQASAAYVIHGADKSNPGIALCVNGDPPLVTGPLQDQGDGTVLDAETRLQWIKNAKPPSQNGLSWQAALDYCENQNLGQMEDWRLPTIKELQTLITNEVGDADCMDPAFNIMGNTPAFWSSTPTIAGNEFLQLTVQGCSTNSSNEAYFWATCVRNKP